MHGDYTVMEKIAVHCSTEEEWNAVRIKADNTFVSDWQYIKHYIDVCIYVSSDNDSFDRKEDCLRMGTKVVTAEEYLEIEPLIAVECLSKETWNTVQKAMFEKGKRWQTAGGNDSKEYRNLFEERECCCLTEYGINGRIQVSSKEFWISREYKIISAKEYLGPPKKTRKIGSLGIDFNTIVKRKRYDNNN